MPRLELTLLVALLTATGCTSTSADKGTPDGAAPATDARSDSSPDPTGFTCAAVGGQCETSGSCSNRSSLACDPGAGSCCLDNPICPDASSKVVQGSNYDQSCTTDSDCITVAAGDACLVCVIACQLVTAAINTAALPRYRADIAGTLAAERAGAGCFCPQTLGLGAPCCRGGMCSTDACPAPGGADAGDACAAAGGKCFFGAQLSCSIVGSEDCGSRGFCCLDDAFASDAAAE